MIPATAPALLTVDLSAIRENYSLFKEMTQSSVAGILKADAYGTGAAEIFKTLKTQGCRDFFVATPDEAFSLRSLDKKGALYVLGGLYDAAADYAANNIIPVLNSREEIERWELQAQNYERPLPCALHFDTGMNRLGLSPVEAQTLATELKNLDIRIVMSHFACSDEKGHPMNDRQAAMFAELAKVFSNAGKSLCNSSGLFRNPGWHHDLVRPGYALYGGNPTPETASPVRRVVDYSVRILQIRDAQKGETAGYNATHIFKRDTKLATVALGYADGFLRGGSNRAKLYWQGRPCPVVGRVSMDLVIVELGDAPARQGDWLEVLGTHQSVDDLARDCGTIGYEILTSLRLSRAYRMYR